MSSELTTAVLMKRAKLPRHAIKILSRKLGIRPTGTVQSRNRVTMDVWPESCVEPFRAAYKLIKRDMNGGAEAAIK